MEILTVPYILSLVALFFLYTIGLYIHRIFFDSLSKFPGPKLAAASQWYEFYYDVVLKGKYTFEIARMHQKYGTSHRDPGRITPKMSRQLLNVGRIRSHHPYQP